MKKSDSMYVVTFYSIEGLKNFGSQGKLKWKIRI